MADLNRLMASQNFETEEDLNRFMQQFVGKPIPSFPADGLSSKEKAQDLVFEAYDLPNSQAKKKINEALQLDADCIEAYEFLGTMERTIGGVMKQLEKGIEIGKRLFGGEYLEKNKGYFWGLHETRPYMRCLQIYADCLYDLGRVDKATDILEEIIELNPNDNQGVRNQLLLWLIELDEPKKFRKYADMYTEDAMTFSLFNHALFSFTQEGPTIKTNNLLQKAMKSNRFVVPKILSKKKIEFLGESYQAGGESEADYYVYQSKVVWKRLPGAMDWLKRFEE